MSMKAFSKGWRCKHQHMQLFAAILILFLLADDTLMMEFGRTIGPSIKNGMGVSNDSHVASANGNHFNDFNDFNTSTDTSQPSPMGGKAQVSPPGETSEVAPPKSRHTPSEIMISTSKGPSSVATVAIIGVGGFIGTALSEHLSGSKNFDIHGYDRDPRALSVVKDIKIDIHGADSIHTVSLQSKDAVIFLGSTSREASNSEKKKSSQVHSSESNKDVDQVLALAKRMKPSQLLIFASSAAVTNGSGRNAANESYPVDRKTLDPLALSFYKREVALHELSKSKTAPKIIGLRLGSVVGHSAGQRVDSLHLKLLRSAFTTGVLTIRHLETNIAVLALKDLCRSVEAIMRNPKHSRDFEIFHLASFNTLVSAVGNEVAMHTGARIQAIDVPGPDIVGSHLNTSKFQKRFRFEFEGNQSSVVRNLLQNIPSCIMPKGVHATPPLEVGGKHAKHTKHTKRTTPCPICGSHDVHSVLDMGEHPVGDGFRQSKDDNRSCSQQGLHLVRCRSCHHLFTSTLSQNATKPSESRFAEREYGSRYMRWVMRKVGSDIAERTGARTLLVIRNNYADDEFHRKFQSKTWTSLIIPKDLNLTSIRNKISNLSKTHTASTAATAILVNEFQTAPYRNPFPFLTKVRSLMDNKTSLYIRFSACTYLRTAHFPRLFSGRISIYTVHSLRRAMGLARLYIRNIERLSSANDTCMVTIGLPPHSNSTMSASANQALEREAKDMISNDFTYVHFRERANFMRAWVSDQLRGLTRSGYTIGMLGSQKEGMSLMYFLMGGQRKEDWSISFSLADDFDASPKYNLCTDPPIPRKPMRQLSHLNPKLSIALLLLDWTRIREFRRTIGEQLAKRGGSRSILVFVPFPDTKIVRLRYGTSGRLEEETILVEMPYRPRPWKTGSIWPEKRREMLMVSHFFNEEFLMPYFIRHHAPMFDRAVLLDYGSNDNSVDILKREAPSSWVVVTPNSTVFNAWEVDREVEYWEKTRPLDWKIALTTTEFLLHPDLRADVATKHVSRQGYVSRFPAVMICGSDDINVTRFRSLPEQRSVWNGGVRGMRFGNNYRRFIHAGIRQIRYYNRGRHVMFRNVDAVGPKFWDGLGVVLKFSWTPWPEVRSRKLQIGSRIPTQDRKARFGIQHIDNMVPKTLDENKRRKWTPGEYASDLKDVNADNEPGTQHLASVWRTYQETIVPRDVYYSPVMGPNDRNAKLNKLDKS
ncbi:hypothetical protein AAMO2058_000000700 [Amorphochlora amoebiformis]